MSKCWNCGEETQGKFCPNCGEKTREVETATSAPPLQNENRLPVVPMFDLSSPPPVISTQALPTRIIDTQTGGVTGKAFQIAGHSDEAMVWTGRPSPFILIWRAVVWGIVVMAALLLALMIHGGYLWVVFWSVCATVNLSLNYFALNAMRYRVTSQRVEVTDGLMHQQQRTYEVHHLGDAAIDSPLLFRLLGLSTLTLNHLYGRAGTIKPVRIMQAAPDVNAIPVSITLLGISAGEVEKIRDILREAGQIEGGRLDKIRFR